MSRLTPTSLRSKDAFNRWVADETGQAVTIRLCWFVSRTTGLHAGVAFVRTRASGDWIMMG